MRDINLEDTIYPRFTTRAFATGIPTTLAGTPVLSVYEENNLTQITAGVSITADYDSVTGLNQATIVATAANGYEAGKSYDLVITTGTVGGVSVVGEVVHSFTVEQTPKVNVTFVSGTAQTANDNGADINTLLTRIVGTLAAGTHNPASAAQIAVLSDWINGGRLDLFLDAIKVVTDAQTAISPADLITLIFDRSLAAHQTALTAGRAITLGGVPIAETTAAGTPTTTSIQLAAGSAVDGFYEDSTLTVLSGAGAGQARPIATYTGATKTCAFDEAFTTAPANGDVVAVRIDHVHPVSEIQAGLATTVELDKVPKSDGTVAHNATALAAITADVVGDAVIAELTTQGDTNEAVLNQLNLGIIYGAAATGTLSTTQATSDLTGYTVDQLIGRIITVTSGVAEGESSAITDYVEVNGLITFDLMTLAMGNGDTFKIT